MYQCVKTSSQVCLPDRVCYPVTIIMSRIEFARIHSTYKSRDIPSGVEILHFLHLDSILFQLFCFFICFLFL